VAYLVSPGVVYLIARWMGASALFSGGLAGGWLVFAVFLVEVLGRGLVDWMRVVRSG
jgi:hypothetical protein